MAEANADIASLNEDVDVDVSLSFKDNKLESETITDSGIDATDSSQNKLTDEIYKLNIQDEAIDFKTPNDVSQENVQNSLSLDSDDITDNSLNLDDTSSMKNENFDTSNPDISPKNDISDLKYTSDSLENSSASNPLIAIAVDNDTFHGTSQNFAVSTISLNDQVSSSENRNKIINSLPFSRSAENIPSTISIYNENTNIPHDLDTEKVLMDFNNQKTKVSATFKIPTDTQPLCNNDNKYPRIPRELLSQDLGSIVKNVHGIFSSVSGSLKNAYNISHRASLPKPIVTAKPIANSKIMDEIFEENVPEQNIPKDIKDIIDITNIDDIKTTNNQEVLTTDLDLHEKKDIAQLQVESLERLLAEQRKEMAALRERVKQQTDELSEKDLIFKDLEGKMDLMRKRVEHAERKKDAAVMRYASSECTVIEAKKAADNASKAERAALNEVELLGGKLKSAFAEKQRICQLYDDKCHELQNTEHNLAKCREDLKELEGRLKWTQSKLRMEMDAYKETAERVEKLTQQVADLETAKDAAVANAADTIRAKQLEAELKECQAALILHRHERAELEKRVSSLSHQLDNCVRERDEATASLARVTAEVERLRESNARLEEEAAALAALRARAALADTLSSQLQRQTELLEKAEAALAKESARADTCARREAAALEHGAALTARHVAISADAQRAQDQAQALAADNASLRERLATLEGELTSSKMALGEETDRRNKENRVLARKVAELTEELAETNKKLEWEKGENGVLKKKHGNAIKELNRELQRALKRCEQLEAKIPQTDNERSDRTGSVSSLSSGESGPITDERLQNGHGVDCIPDIQVRSPDRQALIERIVSLQRAAARRAERCDFLEEHAKQLTDELRKKSKLLRQFLCSTPAGALADNSRDVNKKEIARLGGGAMAAVWGGDPNGMTLELSLEMNKKLQAVLEDTLLKNITLKENMDTLGKEIARLKGQKQPDSK